MEVEQDCILPPCNSSGISKIRNIMSLNVDGFHLYDVRISFLGIELFTVSNLSLS